MPQLSERPLPFSVVRNSSKTLVEQVVAGLKQAIDFGKYEVGETIPGTRDLAEMLGVSRIVTRQAIRRLADNGYVSPRPGVGCVVLARGVKLWKGSILLVMHASKGYYYSSSFADELVHLFAKEGWRLVRVLDRAGDQALLDLELSHKPDFAIVMFENEPAVARLRRASVPFACIGHREDGCSLFARYRREAGLAEAVRELKESGVKTAWQVGFEHQAAELEVLKTAGFDCREVLVDRSCKGNVTSTESAIAMFRGLLEMNSCSLPDFIYFTDDGICQGALLMFLRFGIRIPEDVRILSWSNNGHGPYYDSPIPLSMISTADNARVVAAAVLEILSSGKAIAEPLDLATIHVKA